MQYELKIWWCFKLLRVRLTATISTFPCHLLCFSHVHLKPEANEKIRARGLEFRAASGKEIYFWSPGRLLPVPLVYSTEVPIDRYSITE